MAGDIKQILDTARLGFSQQDNELQLLRAQQPMLVVSSTATGSGDIDHLFKLDRSFRLVFVRCHYTGTIGKAPMTLSLSSTNGTAYDVLLYTLMRVGVGGDVNFRITAEESQPPSSWTFQAGDQLRIQWVSPDSGNITWGLQVGLAIAS